MNIREDLTIRAPTGKDDVCAKLMIDNADEPFVFHGIAEEGQQYTLSFYAKSEGAGSITAGNTAMATSSSWRRYVVTFMADSTDIPVYFTAVGTYYLYNTQLEIGCKDTDFALNPADTEEDVDALKVITEKHSTSISVLQGEIALRVTASEVNGLLADYSTTAEMEAAITVSKESITQSVSETYETKVDAAEKVDNALLTAAADATEKSDSALADAKSYTDALEIGGRNLLRNSNFATGNASCWGRTSGAAYSVIEDTTFGHALSFSANTADADRIFQSPQYFSHVNNETYTLSYYMKADSAASVRVSVSGSYTIRNHNVTPEWTKYTATYTAYATGSLSFHPMRADVTFYLVNVKLEHGSKATDWTPAPEDTDSKITSLETWKTEASQKITKDGIVATVGNYYAYQSDLTSAEDRIAEAESTLTQHADEIALRVTKDGVIGAINLTSEEAKIIAEKITLEGATIADAFTCTNLTVTGDSVFEGVLNGATGDFSGEVTANTLYATNSGQLSFFKFDGSGMWADLTNDTTNDYFFGKYAFYARAYDDSDVEKAHFYMSTQTDLGGQSGKVEIFGNSSIVLATSSAVYITNSSTGSTVVTIDTSGNIDAYGTVTGAGGFKTGSTAYKDGLIELYGSAPCIDFRYGDSTAEYTSRIIEESSGLLKFTGAVTVAGALNFLDWGGGTGRRPVGSMHTDGNRTAYISSKINDSGTYYLTVNGQYGTTGSTYSSHNINCTSSDVRLKTNIVDTDVKALQVINQMQLRQFDWRENGIRQKIGFVADELESLDPALAIGGGYDNDGNMDIKSVNEFYLAGYLTKGIQELYAVQTEQADKLLTHKSQIEYLLDENAALKKRVKELEKQIA